MSWAALLRACLKGALIAILAGGVLLFVLGKLISASIFIGLFLMGAASLFRHPLTEALLAIWGHFSHQAARDAYGEWADGRYFAYQGQQLRYWEQDEEVWFAAADIAAALDKPFDTHAWRFFLDPAPPAAIPRQIAVVRLAQLDAYLARCEGKAVNRFSLWFEREVRFPLRRAAEQRRIRQGLAVAEHVEPPARAIKPPADDSNPRTRGQPQ